MEKEMKKEVMLEDDFENENVIHCEEPKVLSRRIVEEDGVEFTEEELELVDSEGRASTITVKYTAGQPLNSVFLNLINFLKLFIYILSLYSVRFRGYICFI
ncbi:hypothetical protein QOZ84_02075 [Romboutsia sedimentorum]|uniref:Uncharacterized protein n=1 Tax=Romboutsia sedimentorum TaxID=1368474 RepID=A0ABT7E5W6_9FIRM|nr:hypothetical protein [Romboutsia sedimentorum]MDK2562321.1 hypothetical protein [Romboutsia sedimentorum]